MRLRILTAAVIAWAGLGSVPARATEVDREFLRSFPAGAGTLLHLVHGDGNVTVTPWERDSLQVAVRYHASVTAIGIGSNPDYDVEFRQSGNTVHVIGKEQPTVTVGMVTVDVREHVYEIHAPAGTVLDLEGQDGTVTVSGWRADIDVKGEDGSVELRDVQAKEIRIAIEDAPVLLDGVKAPLFVDGEDGELTIESGVIPKGHLRLEDGDVVLRSTAGSFDIELEDGDVRASRARLGSMSIRTADGGVELDLLDDPKLDVDVTTEDGPVRIDAAPDASFTFTVRTQDGSIRVDLPGASLSHQEDHRVEGTYHGDRGKLRVKTADGKVELRQRSADPD